MLASNLIAVQINVQRILLDNTSSRVGDLQQSAMSEAR
jgi:hypothetical protein